MSQPGAVLVTDAPSNANLAVVRALGRRGIPVDVCGFPGEFNLSFYSRYARERVLVPSPTHDPAAFVDAVCDALGSGRYAVLLPTTERTIQLLSACRDRLPAGVQVPMPEREAMEAVLDKERTVALARSVGVPAPATWCPDGPDDLGPLAASLPYPVIVKPRQTNFLAPEGRLTKAGYRFASNAEELMRGYRAIHTVVPRPLVQELVHGTGCGVFSIWDHGTPLGWFAHRRLREEDPQGGRASAAVSVPCDPRLVECASGLLKALRWHGVAMVEFKWDEARDAFWLMEVNGRLWGSLALALAAGMDFPYYLYQLACGESVQLPASYRRGVVARDAVAELKHFARMLRAGGGPSCSAFRWETLRQAGTILHPTRHSYNWVPDDPAPGRREWLWFLRQIVRRGVTGFRP